MPNPTPTIFVPYHAIDDLHRIGTRAAQPAANSVTPGTLYCVTNEGNKLERSNGSVWQTYESTGGVTFSMGQWTPTILGSSGSVTYAAQYGSYVKINQMVFGTCQVGLSSKGSITGALSIGGLPFKPQSVLTQEYWTSSSVQWSVLSVAWSYIWALILPGSLTMLLRGTGTAPNTTSSAGVTATDLTNTSSFIFSFFYIAES